MTKGKNKTGANFPCIQNNYKRAIVFHRQIIMIFIKSMCLFYSLKGSLHTHIFYKGYLINSAITIHAFKGGSLVKAGNVETTIQL